MIKGVSKDKSPNTGIIDGFISVASKQKASAIAATQIIMLVMPDMPFLRFTFRGVLLT